MLIKLKRIKLNSREDRDKSFRFLFYGFIFFSEEELKISTSKKGRILRDECLEPCSALKNLKYNKDLSVLEFNMTNL